MLDSSLEIATYVDTKYTDNNTYKNAHLTKIAHLNLFSLDIAYIYMFDIYFMLMLSYL